MFCLNRKCCEAVFDAHPRFVTLLLQPSMAERSGEQAAESTAAAGTDNRAVGISPAAAAAAANAAAAAAAAAVISAPSSAGMSLEEASHPPTSLPLSCDLRCHARCEPIIFSLLHLYQQQIPVIL